jgi:alpha-tubulin suppressor-like RCC1 family protein
VSEPIQVSGINFATSISVTGGQYSINGGAFTSSSGMVGPGDSVRVQVAASANFNTVSSATLTIGGVSSVFQAVTAPSATFTTPSQIDGGLHHTVVLKSDGSVWAWGADTAGQFNAVPTDTGLYGVKAVAAGLSASFALRPDGAVWAWGDNVDGQLGDGSNGHKDPRLIPGLSGVVAIAAGGYHTLGLKDDGTLWGWGANDHGALGNNTTSKSAVPVQASVPPGVMAIATGLEHSLALVSDETGITGTVWAWGWNAFGQLGDGTNDDKLKPTQVPGLTGVIAIAAGAYHSLALKADGTIWAWGYNVNGELGNNGSANALIPVQVVDAGGLGFNAKVANSQLAAIKIAAGSNHSFALKSDGTVWAWGSNLHGQLGDGSTTNRAVPVAVVGLDGVAGVVGGGAAHSTAVMADGTLRVWGWNAFQTLGDGTNTDRLVPEEVVGPEGNFFALPKTASTPDPFHFVSRFGAALNAPVVSSEVTVSGTSAPSSVAIASVPPGAQYSVNGGAYTAAPATVNLGDVLTIRMNASSSYAATSTATLAISGVTGSYSVVTQRDPAAQVVAQGIAAGYHHTLVMRSDGMVWGFGYNGYGQLANGTTLSRSAPQFLSHLTNVVQIAAGHFHTLALKADGTLVASGWNGAGQLGDGSANASRLLPVPVVGSGGLGLLSNIVAIAAGHAHSLAVDKSGNVWAWGLNSDGQLGNGTVTPSYTPVRVTGLSKVVAVAAGNNHSVALTSDGTLWSWGNNDYGQLGTGTVSGRRVPVQIALGQVAKIAAGYAYTLALRNDGSVWAWGQNTFGQLGLGDNIGVSLPALVPGLEARVTAIAAGQFHSLAVKAGQLYAWGKNSNGQIGDGTSNNPIRPLAVSALGGTNIVSVAGGGAYSAALSDAGVLYSFGDNTFGQVGNRSGNYSPQRARMNILRGDVDISDFTVAAYSALALQSTAGSNAVNLDKLGPMVFSTTQPLKTPSAQQTVQFVNDSLESNIPNVVFAAAGPFSVVSHNCPGIVPPQGNCQVKLTFTPIQPGAQTGELQAKWIDSGSQMLLAFPLQGTGAPLATTATVAANVIATTVGANVTLTATIFGGSNPSGMVQFKVNGVNIGAPVTVTAGQAQLTINSLVVGSQTITAVYSGDSNNAGSTAPGLTETVSPAVTSVGVASSAGSPRFGQSVTLTATISGGVNPTGTVQFKDGGINLGVPVAVVGGTAVLSTTALIVGSHSIAATYAGDANNLGSTSAPLTQVVNANGGGGPAVPTMPEWAVLLLGSLLIFIARRGLIRS